MAKIVHFRAADSVDVSAGKLFSALQDAVLSNPADTISQIAVLTALLSDMVRKLPDDQRAPAIHGIAEVLTSTAPR